MSFCQDKSRLWGGTIRRLENFSLGIMREVNNNMAAPLPKDYLANEALLCGGLLDGRFATTSATCHSIIITAQQRASSCHGARESTG